MLFTLAAAGRDFSHLDFTGTLGYKNPDAAAAEYGNGFEGDIILLPEELALLGVENPERRRPLAQIKHDRKRWPASSDGAVYVPIRIDTSHPSMLTVNNVIKEARAHFEDVSCIRLKGRQGESDYIKVIDENWLCQSSVGMKGGMQIMKLSDGCHTRGTVVHEFMHALGFWHEQSRSDRDNKVDVNWNNIKTGKSGNFNKYSNSDSMGHPYDYGSIMHYGTHAFSKNGQKTLESKGNYWTRIVNEMKMGQRKELSHWDIQDLNKAYCNYNPSVTNCKCETPKQGTIGKNRIVCDNNVNGGYCASHQECYREDFRPLNQKHQLCRTA